LRKLTEDSFEIHTVGASGLALGELMDQIEGTIVSDCDLDDDVVVTPLGQHPDCPTGYRVVNAGSSAFSNVRGVFEDCFEGVEVTQ
jgi:hypothetical protein